jgi:hypothetical protein
MEGRGGGASALLPHCILGLALYALAVPDQDGMHVGIAPSRPVNGPCPGADRGAAGIAQHSEG